jgi:hypothetical protein
MRLMMNKVLENLLSLVELDGLDMWWGLQKVIMQTKSFVTNQDKMEIEGDKDRSSGGAMS